jgi:hypothetical protein
LSGAPDVVRLVLSRCCRALEKKRKCKALVEDEQKLARVVERIGEILVERPGAGRAPHPPQSAPASSQKTGVTFSTLRGTYFARR